MFDNNDFLSSYKKNMEGKNPDNGGEPAEETSIQNTTESADIKDELSDINDALSDNEVSQDAGKSENKSIWGDMQSAKDDGKDTPQNQEAEVQQGQGSAVAGVSEFAGDKDGITFDIPPVQSAETKKTVNKAQPPKATTQKSATGKSYEEKSKFSKPEPQYHERRYYDGYEPPKKPVLRNIIIAAISVLVLIVVIILIASNASKVEVKDFSGWTRGDFMLWANENEVLMQIDEEYDEQVTADQIISQSILAGEKMKKGDFIRVAVSKGPDLSIVIMMPDLMNMTKDQIEQWADENFMTKVRITTEFNGEVAAGHVIKYEINDNTVVDEIKRDTPIYIYISKGPQDQTSIEVEIPDFKTMGVSETVLFAQENGLEITIEEFYDDYVPKGSIISQTPKAKEKSHVGATIKIIVSLGKKVFMPDFSGMTKEQAQSLASQYGINATIKDRYSSTKEGNFSYQTVDPGTEVTDDTTVTIYYSLGPNISITSYVGQQLNQLEQWIETVNADGAKLTLTKTYTQNSAASGVILQQNKENTYITRGTALTVVVSSGQKIFVPDFVADNSDETPINRETAQQMCDDTKIVALFVAEAKSGKTPGEIWYQSIAAGTEVNQGAVITLKYNPVTGSINVPSFAGKTETQIKAMTEYSKLTVTFVAGSSHIPGQEGISQSQSVAAGTTVAQGTSVTITMAPVKVPDFTGMDQVGVQALYPDDSILKITFFGTGTTVSAQTIAADELVKAGTAITLTLS